MGVRKSAADGQRKDHGRIGVWTGRCLGSECLGRALDFVSVATVKNGGGLKPLAVPDGIDADGAGECEPILGSSGHHHLPASFPVFGAARLRYLHFRARCNPTDWGGLRRRTAQRYAAAKVARACGETLSQALVRGSLSCKVAGVTIYP